jgi:two-component system, sensor histidine kinase and response regulator
MQTATILLVEDEPDMLRGMYDLLQIVDTGYDLHVVTANNGEAGLAAVAQHNPDLIVSDIMMPLMNGYELLQAVRRNPNWTHIPFIFLTAKGSHEDVHKGLTSGANLYITKPFNPKELVELIQVQLNRSRQLQATRQENMGTLKRNLLQILNHEFRTPLTYVTAYLDMIVVDTGHGIGDNFSEYLRGIQAGCVRLTQLVRDFIRVLELRTGEMEQVIQENAVVIDTLPALLSETMARAQPLANNLMVTVEYEEPSWLPPVYGVAKHLQDAIGRILDNAIKFTHKFRKQPASVRVETAVIDQEIHINIQDQGMGFPPQVSERLFELFYQHNREQYEQQGAGAGLTIAHGLVTLHGGRIDVISLEKDGSTFTVVLPVYQEASADQQLATGPAKTATVLIVEDDYHLLVGLQEMLQLFVETYKLTVLTAENGRAGLEILAQHQPDLIISDIMMPEMNGYEFLAEVRKNPKWIQIPFIFLTAKGEEHEIYQGLRSGVEQYITKPYTSNELIDLVVSQLDRHFQIQSATSQDFESLKRNILDLITPDLQQPLSSVAQFSTELETRIQEVSTDKELINSLEDIQADSVTLTNLVEDLITLAELWTGEAVVGYEMRACPISSPYLLLHETVQQYQLDARQPVDLFLREGDQQAPPIYGVSTLITDSLHRLIEACLQRQTEPGVVLSLETAGDNLHLIITANLPLNQEELDQMQALFAGQRLATLGLLANTSLQIAQGNIDLHNGQIAIQPLDPEAAADGSSQPYQIIVAIPIYRQ